MGKEQLPYRGISEQDFLRGIAVDVINYINWYAEHGIFLPEEYAADPGAYTQILRNIQAGFEVILGDPDTEDAHAQELLHNGKEQFYQYAKYLWK